VSHHHTVILTDSSPCGGGLGCAVEKAVSQNLTAKLGRGWARVAMSKALLISVTGDRHDVPVWDSCIRPPKGMAVVLTLWLV